MKKFLLSLAGLGLFGIVVLASQSAQSAPPLDDGYQASPSNTDKLNQATTAADLSQEAAANTQVPINAALNGSAEANAVATDNIPIGAVK